MVKARVGVMLLLTDSSGKRFHYNTPSMRRMLA